MVIIKPNVCLWDSKLMAMMLRYNRDNVEWTEEQETAAKKKVLENNQPLPLEKQGCFCDSAI